MTDVELRLTADLSSATREVSGFRKEYAELVRAVEKPLRQVDALQQTQDNAKKAAAEFYAAKTAVEQLKKATASAGQPIQGLNQELARAERVLARTTLEFEEQKAKVREQRAELRAAGVDTHNLATEQQRLQAEMAAGLGAGRSDLATQGIRAKAAALAQVTREQRLANLESARGDLGVNRARALTAEVARLKAQYELLRRSGGLTSKELAIAQQTMTRRVKETQQAMRELAGEQSRGSAGRNVGGAVVGGIAAGAAAFAAVRGVANTADAYQLMNARLKLATGSQLEFNAAQDGLQRIAAATSSPVESLVTLYGRISRPLKEAGRAQKDILGVTEAVAVSFKVSGASAEEAQNGVIQFAQALGSGALRGDEFNSVAEQAPRLMQALADGIGVPVTALRDLAGQGKLTAGVVTEALIGQLPKLQQELAGFGDTVSGQVVQIEDTLKRGFGSADTGPLIDSLKELKATLEDPSVIQNLTLLAGALVKVASYVPKAGSAFVDYGKDLGYLAAAASGNIDELARVDKEIEKLKASAGSNVGLFDLYMSNDGIAARLAEVEAYRQKLLEQRTGMTEDARKAAEELTVQVQAVEDARHDASLSAQKAYIGVMSKLRDQQVAAKEAALKKEIAAEQRAKTAIEKIRTDRAAIDQRYNTAITEMNAGGAAEPSYGAAQSLKVGAQDALRKGDVSGAQAQAQAALKILQDLAAAGENTYGFAGFIEGLRGIELQANDIEQSRADEKLKSITDNIAVIKQAADGLQNLKITLNLPPEELERVKAQLEALAGVPIIIPVQLGPTPEMAAIGLQGTDQVSYPGFSPGGWTGPGDKYKRAGIVHADEHVQPKRVVNEPGALSFLEQIRRNGYRNTMASLQARMATTVRGYAEGGLVMPSRAMPSIPQISPALLSQGSPGRDLGRVDLNIGGETISLLADQQNFTDLVKRQSWKRGSTRR